MGNTLSIKHTWRNSGVGVCPNNNKRWNYKYKVSFALLDPESHEIKQRITDENAEPSAWIKGTDKTYKTSESLIVPAGQYILAVAITDDTQSKTGIESCRKKREIHKRLATNRYYTNH